MTTCHFSDDQKLNTLLSQINSQGIVSGADARQLVKILRGMGPRPSADELTDMFNSTPGTTPARLSRCVGHVLQHLYTHLDTNLTEDFWLEEIINWQKGYLDED